MRYNEFLIERVVNLLEPEDKKKYIDVLAPMLAASYADIGGFMNITDMDELKAELETIADEPGIWKLIRKDGKIVAGTIYKLTDMGRKAVATTGAAEGGKEGVYHIKGEDVKMKRMYAEVSDKMEHIMINKFGAKPIHNKYASAILGKEVERLEDNYHYKRMLGGHMHTKILVGRLDDEAWEYIKQQVDNGDDDILVIDNAA